MFTLCLVVLKCAIMILLPIISFILYLPSGLHTNWTQIPITSNSIFKGIFRTIWAYFGIESIATDKTAHYKTLRFAMLAGVFICLVTYLLNTVILFTTVPNLATSKSCFSAYDFEAFSMAAWVLCGSNESPRKVRSIRISKALLRAGESPNLKKDTLTILVPISSPKKSSLSIKASSKTKSGQ